jgi:valyl-tRNA synthetase
MELDKAYEPAKYEQDMYKLWEDAGAFKPSDTQGEPFSILMPPPNANADLHIGHTLTTTLEDIMARYARMNGRPTLFLPGADHAGFETQVVYERKLEAEGKSRFDYSRGDLYQQIWDYVQTNKVTMENQQRRIGASVDWSRNTFTLDPKIVNRAYQTFQKLWDDGLLYRGKRIVNYCTKHNTSFSDLEVEHRDEASHLWEINYAVEGTEQVITVATTRPETMLGDTAIAVHPDDIRYANLIGLVATVPLTGRQIPIVGDEAVDPKFGTGAVKVTPAHDPTDFEIGERHSLPQIQVIGFDGKMTEEAGKAYQGLTVNEARMKVVTDLEKTGSLGKVTDYTHSVGHCYKCDTVIEPMVIDQWLVRMKPLAAEAIKALEAGQIKIVPQAKLKVLFQWLENIRDWNVSRQIAWGIPIPGFIAGDGDVLVDIDEKSDQITRDGKAYRRDPDTFDTWFSSGQWPFATLDYPDGEDFKRFYPTTVMETAGEIIFFWVARMIMLSLYVTGEIPFKTVYMHGLVTDAQGKKMSKSKGNVLAPLPLLEKYGADALRMGIVANRSAGLNQGFDEKRVETYRNFCNKLWNVARYSLSQLPESYSPTKPKPTTLADEWILAKLQEGTLQITKAIESYRFAEALESLYSLLWNDFADWYIEASKVSPNPDILVHGLKTILALAHPFAPFVTEAIWQKMPWEKQNLIVSAWPTPSSHQDYSSVLVRFSSVISVIEEIRALSVEMKLIKPTLTTNSDLILENAGLVTKLAGLGAVTKDEQGSGLALSATEPAWLQVDAETLKHYLDDLRTRHIEQGKYLETLERQLANQQFLASAPDKIVQDARDRREAAQMVLSKLDEQIKRLDS